jgi:hypothetical protein
MKNPIAISIIFGSILFTAMYGWINRYEYQTFVGKNDMRVDIRRNVFTGYVCVIFPPAGVVTSYDYSVGVKDSLVVKDLNDYMQGRLSDKEMLLYPECGFPYKDKK